MSIVRSLHDSNTHCISFLILAQNANKFDRKGPPLRRYRTEIVIPPDRFIGLHLPPHLPEGRAVITVIVLDPDLDASPLAEAESDRQDIEWWEEFDDGTEADAS